MQEYDWEFQSPTARGPLVLMHEAHGKLRYLEARIRRLEETLTARDQRWVCAIRDSYVSGITHTYPEWASLITECRERVQREEQL